MAWQVAALKSEVAPNRPKIIEVQGKQVGVLQDGDKYFAVLNFCSQRGSASTTRTAPTAGC